MTFQFLNQLAVFFVPDVHIALYQKVNMTYTTSRLRVKHTFAPSYHETLIGTTKRGSDDIRASFLSGSERTNGFSCIQIQHSSFAINFVDQEESGILTDGNRAEISFEIHLVFKLACNKIVHVDVLFVVHSYQTVTIRRHREVLNSVASAPIINELAVEIPLAKIPFFVEAACYKGFAIGCPDTAANWLSETGQGSFNLTSLKCVVSDYGPQPTGSNLRLHSIIGHACPGST